MIRRYTEMWFENSIGQNKMDGKKNEQLRQVRELKIG